MKTVFLKSPQTETPKNMYDDLFFFFYRQKKCFMYHKNNPLYDFNLIILFLFSQKKF